LAPGQEQAAFCQFFNDPLSPMLQHKPLSKPTIFACQAAWYIKTTPTFSDALAAVRAHWWRAIGLATSPHERDMTKVPRSVFRRLHDVACYAA
jgi:hypothetical protein